jgi:broad-specificity NMP kinase
MSDRIRIIEIVGPPGSGKSSLATRLCAYNSKIQAESFPYYKRVNCIPFFIKNFLFLLPIIIRLKRDAKKDWLIPRDIVSMIILSGWPRELNEKLSKNSEVTLLLDEGAVIILAWLKGFGSKYMNSDVLQQWRQHTYSEWAGTIDLIIQLETPVTDLMKRIRERDRTWDHLSDNETLNKLETTKKEQNEVLSILTSLPNAPKVIRASTLGKSPEQIGEEILDQLGWVK